MMEFFRGWRKKVGCITLMMALTFMGLWVRSVIIHEVTSVLTSRQAQLFIDSGDGIFWFGRFLGHDPDYFSTQPTMRWGQLEDNLRYNREEWKDTSWYRCFSEVGIGGHSSGANPNGKRYEYFTFIITPYWSIVIPLTLLSAFLLLSKPRKSNQKKIPEPISVEGA